MKIFILIFLSVSSLFILPNANAMDAQSCLLCHDTSFNSAPNIFGQSQFYLAKQLNDFKFSNRLNSKMNALASSMTSEEIQKLAEFFSTRPWQSFSSSPPLSPNQDRAEILISQIGCRNCHGNDLKGLADSPRLAGQSQVYLQAQLKKFRGSQRQNDLGQMFTLTQFLSDEDIAILSRFISEIK